jgi:Asp-tRNA(Asn)/Glu-tRNA(Gln) amidotransferase A subunit family amidase
MNLTLKAYIEGVESGKLNPETVIKEYLTKAKKLNAENNAFTRFHEDYVEKNLSTFKNLSLHGAPIGIKDIILTKGYISSC